MHLPVLPLFPGAVGRLMRFQCLLVDGFQGEVQKDVLHLACIDIVLLDLRYRPTGVPTTEGSLVVGKFNDRDFGLFRAHGGITLDIDDHFLELGLLRSS